LKSDYFTMPNGSGTIVGHAALPASLAWGSQHRLAARPIALQLQQVLGAIDAAATAAMRASFDLLIMTPLLIGSEQRLAAIVALQANLDSQRLNTVPTAHFHQHQRALFQLRARATSSAAGAWRAAEPITSFREA
jgi:hypothetical protein